jgi:hypothetical protein
VTGTAGTAALGTAAAAAEVLAMGPVVVAPVNLFLSESKSTSSEPLYPEGINFKKLAASLTNPCAESNSAYSKYRSYRAASLNVSEAEFVANASSL